MFDGFHILLQVQLLTDCKRFLDQIVSKRLTGGRLRNNGRKQPNYQLKQLFITLQRDKEKQ